MFKPTKQQVIVFTSFIIVIIAIVVLIIIRKKNKPMSKAEYQRFFDDLIKYIHRMEGGLSNDLADTASKYPSPTAEKWHTNKGITWKNFVDFSKLLGYVPSVELFLRMPNDLWLDIFKKKYHSKTEGLTNNPVLNSYLALWYWGGWYKGHVSEREVANILVADISERDKLRALVELRKKYFDKVIAAIPTNKRFEKGWKNRAEEYYTLFNKYLS